MQFAVGDTGIGITDKQQMNLFQSFSQGDSSTTRQYGGTGLGLAISYKLVKLMQGQIWVESKENEGSTFYFTVKLKRRPTVIEAESTTAQNQPEIDKLATIERLKGAKILLVEDNKLNQELAKVLLEMNGLIVETAENGKEALELLNAQDFDSVLMDCQMPVMDGYEATQQIRKQEKYKGLPVIAMTANTMKGDKEKTLASGMNDYIAKPMNPDVMFATIAKWIKHR